jgi:hypothetical protein
MRGISGIEGRWDWGVAAAIGFANWEAANASTNISGKANRIKTGSK